MAKLNERQKRFAEEYFLKPVATQAAIRAGYSEKTAYSQGQRLLKNVEVLKLVLKFNTERSKRTNITADRVLEEYAKIGFADIRDIASWSKKEITTKSEDNGSPLTFYDVELKNSDEIDDDTAAAISEITLTPNGPKVKLHDKKGALDSIGKHLGMFPTRVELAGRGGGPIKVTTLADFYDDQTDTEPGSS